jgi:hypothetical protein
MGWCSGGRLFDDVIDTLKKNVSDEDERKAVYLDLIVAFENFDCDVLQECMGVDDMFDEAIRVQHPE